MEVSNVEYVTLQRQAHKCSEKHIVKENGFLAVPNVILLSSG